MSAPSPLESPSRLASAATIDELQAGGFDFRCTGAEGGASWAALQRRDRESRAPKPSRRAGATTSGPIDHRPEVTILLASEHARFRRDLAALLDEHDPLVRRDAFEALARHLVQHEVAEEVAVYPVVAQVEGGLALRTEALRQERELAAHLARCLRRLAWRPRGRKTRHLLGKLAGVLDVHLTFEDSFLIPCLAALGDESKRQMLGTWVGHVERFAPSRPHPHGPQRLPGIMSIGIALTLLDRGRDVGRNLVRGRRR